MEWIAARFSPCALANAVHAFPFQHAEEALYDCVWSLIKSKCIAISRSPPPRSVPVYSKPKLWKKLAAEAFHDSAHFLRPAHLKQLASILDDKDASPNDHFVAWDLLKNANIAAGGILPMCQDTWRKRR